MKRIFGILSQIGGVVVVVTGLVPMFHIIKQSQNDARLGYYEYIYFNYNSILAVIVLLISVAVGIILLWL